MKTFIVGILIITICIISRCDGTRSSSTFKNDLMALLSGNKNSYHQFLWKSNRIARKYYLNHIWEDTKAIMEKQGFVPVKSKEKERGDVEFLYLVAKDVTFSKSKYLHDVYLRFVVVPEDPSDIVFKTLVELSAEVNSSYETVMANKGYSSDSAVYQVLELPEVKEVAIKLPFIEKVQIGYDLIVESFEQAGFFDSGFGVIITLKNNNGVNKVDLYYSVDSRLAPPQLWYDENRIDSFKPQDTLGEIIHWGGANLPERFYELLKQRIENNNSTHESNRDKPVNGK